MAQIEFASPEAKDHLRRMMEEALQQDTLFSRAPERGKDHNSLLRRLTYLESYGADPGRYADAEVTINGEIVRVKRQFKAVIGMTGYCNEASVEVLCRDHHEGIWTPWTRLWVGGLVGHEDGSWLTHT